VAEQLYRALQVWDTLGQGINVTSTSLPFFQRFDSSLTTPTIIVAGSAAYTAMTTAILAHADSFALVAANYTPTSGALSEQYTSTNGTPTSASDLTWSYASVLTMFDARTRTTVESWGASNLTLPSTCSGGGTSSTVIFKVTATTVWGGTVFFYL
jgi:glucoamylase